MNRQKQYSQIMAPILICIAVFCCYFFSEAVLRQFVLHRAGAQSISLSSILGKLPPGIRDEVSRRITIAELKDELKSADTVGKKISVSIRLASVLSPQELQEKYAEIIEKYPTVPEALPAFINFLMAPPTALQSISISQYHKFIKQLSPRERIWAWSSGFAKLKTRVASNQQQIAFLLPLLNVKPDCREYQYLYLALTDLAFNEEQPDIEMKAKKLDEVCDKLSFFDVQLEKKAKAAMRKKAKAKAKLQAKKLNK